MRGDLAKMAMAEYGDLTFLKFFGPRVGFDHLNGRQKTGFLN
jgi:hypothetical protein